MFECSEMQSVCDNMNVIKTAIDSVAVIEPHIIEHKHFEMFGKKVYDCPQTVISREYFTEYKPGMET